MAMKDDKILSLMKIGVDVTNGISISLKDSKKVSIIHVSFSIYFNVIHIYG